jgi:molybdenum cofactor guanylyltransferase
LTVARVAGLVLAGGRGARLGAGVPKPLVELGGRPMIAHVLDRIPSTVSPVVLGANDSKAFAFMPLLVVPDRTAGFRGPLAALDAAAAWLRERNDPATHLLCLPGDTPFLPRDVAARLTANAGDRPRLARAGGRLQPAAALWPLQLLDDLATHIAEGCDLSIARFADRWSFEPIDFAASPDAPDGDAFFNVNTPADLATARAVFETR